MTKKNNSNTKPDTKEIRWRKIPSLADKHLLEELYVTLGTLDSVAEQANCTRYQVYRAVKAHGLDLPTLKLKRDSMQHTVHPSSIRQNSIPDRQEENPAPQNSTAWNPLQQPGIASRSTGKCPAPAVPLRKNRIPNPHIMEFTEPNPYPDNLHSQNCDPQDIYAAESCIWNYQRTGSRT